MGTGLPRKAAGAAIAVGISVGVLAALKPWPRSPERPAIAQPGAALPAPAPEPAARALPAAALRTLAELPQVSPARQPAPAEPAIKTPASAPPATAPAPPAELAATPPPAAPPLAPDPEPVGALPAADYDRALRPLTATPISAGEAAILKDALRASSGGDMAEARTIARRLADPVARKIVQWHMLRQSGTDASAGDIAAFLDANPHWPDRKLLLANAERAVFLQGDAKAVRAVLGDDPPASGAGKAALGGALIAAGDTAKGQALVRQAWTRSDLDSAVESAVLARFDWLTPADHAARADHLLLQNDKARLPAVDRLLPRIAEGVRPSIEARIAAIKGARNATTLIDKLDGAQRRAPGIALAEVRLARRAGHDTRAWALLKTHVGDGQTGLDSLEWWQVRRDAARDALRAGQAQIAYAIASGHGPLAEEFLSEAEFLAGWIALRRLNRPRDARAHFLASAAAGGLPKDRARAAYWLGRTAQAIEEPEKAQRYYRDAAAHYHTYYGQLAHHALEAAPPANLLRRSPRPATGDIARYVRSDTARALAIVGGAELDGLVPLFLYDAVRTYTAQSDVTLLLALAQRVTPPHMAVRAAKIAINRGFAVEEFAYPGSVPRFEALGGSRDVELALVYALTRQESEFNPKASSSAGAVGLMQLLPSTAKSVAKAYDVKYDAARLTSDPIYNVQLGTAYLSDMLRTHRGSYIMTLAAYNAGPGRVRQWIAAYGDPRSAGVDPVDWVESIPFDETRGYVHKIMESLQIYRWRLAGKETRPALAQDLTRGRGGGRVLQADTN